MTHSHDTATPALSVEGAERSDYLSDPQARELWGTEDDEALPDGRVRVCEGEWVRIPGGYYFDGSAGLLHPESASEACDGCEVTISDAPAPKPSPAAKGGEAVRPLKAIGEEAERYRASRGPEWCKIFDTLRDYRMSNMAWEDGEPGYPLVDLMSRVGDTVTIADGEWEMVALADEIGLALATPSPQPAEAVREALIDARNNGLIYWEPNTERGHTSKALMLARIDAALASDPAPAGEAVEPVMFGSFNEWFLSLPVERQAILRDDKWMLAEAAWAARSASREGASDE